jgi:hypothetical protein
MDRPTVELLLPETKAKVTLYQFVSNGQFKEIQAMFVSGVNVDLSSAGDEDKNVLAEGMKSVPASIAFDQQKLLAKFLIKQINLEDGTPVENMEQFVYDLSIADGQVLDEKINEIQESSNLSMKAKKK